MKKILCMMLSIVMLVCSVSIVYASDIQYQQNDFEVFQIEEGHTRTIWDDIIIDDIFAEDFRKITTVIGNDISVYYEELDSGMATLTLNGQVIETYNMNDFRRSITDDWYIPEEDLLILQEFFSEQFYESGTQRMQILPDELTEEYTVLVNNEGVIVEPINTSHGVMIRAASNIVRPCGSVTDTYPEYSRKLVDSKLCYSSASHRNMEIMIKDTMTNYVQTSKKNQFFTAGTALSTMAGALKIASPVLRASLAGLLTSVGGVLKLAGDVDYYYEESYSFYALREGRVYDYTNNNREVAVYSEYGNGKISLTWDYEDNKYTNPDYKITALAYPQTISFDTFYNETLRIWNENIEEYGSWKW